MKKEIRNIKVKSLCQKECKEMEELPKFTIPRITLNRECHVREDPVKIRELYESRDSVLIAWNDGRFLFSKDVSKKQNELNPLLLKTCNSYSDIINKDIGYVFLGMHVETNKTIFTTSIKEEYTDKLKDEMNGEWLELKSNRQWINEMYLETLVTAQGLLIWHHNNLYSGKTGNLMKSSDSGHARIEENKNIFPRIDPAVIGLVVYKNEYCLLGRKINWKKQRYSLLSGFVEVGETLEMALYREILEESNIKIDMDSIVYKGNQPWPYPQSIMIGYHASVSANNKIINISDDDTLLAIKESGVNEDEISKYLRIEELLPEIKIQETEMEDIRWFHIDYINAILNDKIKEISLPDNSALSKQLINDWIETNMKKKWNGDDVIDYEIDNGIFKYIMMRIYDDNGNSKLIIRGNKNKTYHRNILESMDEIIEDKNLKVECLGGGRMHHDPMNKTLFIYGYSSEFGAAVHEITAIISKIWLPLYNKSDIKISYEGY